MRWTWDEYVRLAAWLRPDAAASLHEQARVRSAISRAYYTAFHAAKRHAVTKFKIIINPKRGRPHALGLSERIGHEDLWGHFFDRGRDKDENLVGVLGQGMMKDRHDADYHDIEGDMLKLEDGIRHRALAVCAILKQPVSGMPDITPEQIEDLRKLYVG